MKRAIVRLIIAVFALLASLVELAVRLVQLVIAAVDRLARGLEGRRIVVVEPPKRVPVAPTVNDGEEDRLVQALTGLQFRAASVRAFAATVRARIKTEPMDVLVREGIVHLSSAL
jgi:hypothetical protein